MYQGHHPDGSSIQKHSAGSHYPYVVRVVEHTATNLGAADVVDPSGRIVGTFFYPLGNKEKRLEAYGRAFAQAEELAERRRDSLN
ncbi:hypothetical protein IS481_12140 [Caldimonas thermodepolymerans]|uniref:Uncharacterized protein n=1 Tax=Caldimonas thermodepolymerans TaxID=215580 RepID=A0A2S5T986_9BURK|nr:hypothetical protein [Caldimonas thermodepolymerans]PPE71492.1 hypothetical protein C1702_00365 [Caldimonas thermodepolymerans]QPC30520.1 hypothetical protein IS481_12140 [Caldimonas thermodepolymerans]RDI02892.1 hypothetical protein DES46_102320 [Caldimonas thermodepolymerans]